MCGFAIERELKGDAADAMRKLPELSQVREAGCRGDASMSVSVDHEEIIP